MGLTFDINHDIEWREAPGCFERHLQRRYHNPFFPPERRNVSIEELKQAREKDEQDQKEFLIRFGMWWSEYHRLNEKSPAIDLSKCLQDTQSHLKLAASIGGNLYNQIAVLEDSETKLRDLLNIRFPDPKHVKLMKELKDLSFCACNPPYLAQLIRPDTPILKNEHDAVLLSEDLETIKMMGISNRLWRQYSPDFKPNEDDIKTYLDKAIKEGLDSNYAKEIMEAWNEIKIEPEEGRTD
jgi:hypothetical protein